MNKLARFGKKLICVSTKIISLSLNEVGWDTLRSVEEENSISSFYPSPFLPSSYRYPSKNAKAELKAGVGTPISAAIAITLKQYCLKNMVSVIEDKR